MSAPTAAPSLGCAAERIEASGADDALDEQQLPRSPEAQRGEYCHTASDSGAATKLRKRQRRASPAPVRKLAKLRSGGPSAATEPATPAFPAARLSSVRRRQQVQGLQLRDAIVQTVRQWASQLDDDQLSGPDALDLCCGLFRRYLHSQLAPNSSTPEDAPWESLMKRLTTARKVELAASLWLGLKLTETQTVAPDAVQLSFVTGLNAKSIRLAEVRVCNALDWNLLQGTSAVSPELERPVPW